MNMLLHTKKGELVLANGGEDVKYLVDRLNSDSELNLTRFYWIGQAERLQLSITHSGTMLT